MTTRNKNKMQVDGIECPKCLNQVWSRHRHDMRYCPCGYCYIDGGRDYNRVGWGGGGQESVFGPPENVTILVLDKEKSDA